MRSTLLIWRINCGDGRTSKATIAGEYGFFVTPRAYIKYNPNDFVHFRLSAGKGYRTNHVLAETII